MSRWTVSRRPSHRSALLFAAVALVAVAIPAIADDPAPVQPQTPFAVAESAAKALKEERFGDYARLVHPEERERFRQFGIAMLDAAEASDVLHVVSGFFRDDASRDAIAKADSAEVLADVLQAMTEQIPDFEQTKKDLTFRALGEVEEKKDLVHVVAKTGAPKAGVVTCIQQDGQWYLALPGEVQALMAKGDRLKSVKVDPQNPLAALALLRPDELVSVSVLGQVKEGDDLVWLVCRTGLNPGQGAPVVYRVDAYPIPKSDPAWNYLAPRRRKELEAGLLQSWRASQQNRSVLEGLQLPDGLTLPEGLKLPEGVELPDGLRLP